MDKTLEEILHSLTKSFINSGLKIIIALLILLIGFKIARFITKKIINSQGFKKLDSSVYSFLNALILVMLYTIVIVTAALIAGVPATSFIAILGTAGVALGLALQGAFSNLAGGIMLLIFRPFNVGDYIEADGLSGSVKAISIFYTVLVTPDNKHVTIPNGNLMNSSITNYSAEPTRRLDIVFSVSYDSDIEKVKSIILETVNSHEAALKDPAPAARISNHTQNSLEFTLRVWCRREDFWALKFDLLENTKKAFDQNGIVIPYQQIDVHLDK